MWKRFLLGVAVVALLLGGAAQAARDVTKPGDAVQGVPNDGISQNDDHGWPGNEPPPQAIDDQVVTKYLHFKGDIQPTGIRITPSVGPTVVTGLSLTTANDAEARDPIEYELSGSNESIEGPWTLIASGPVVDFAGATAWPRQTINATPIRFENDVAYEHYQLMFPQVRDPGGENSMQIAEIELLADVFEATNPQPADGSVGAAQPLMQWVAGDDATFHDVYFGTSPDLTAANLVAAHIPFTFYYHMQGFEPGTTYYWRVDQIKADGKVTTGNVWSFMAAPLIAYSPMPRDGDKWIDVDTDLSWMPGQMAQTHDLYFGTDEAAVAARDASVLIVSKLPAPDYVLDTLEADTTYYWAVDENEGGGGVQVGDVWRFTTAGGGGGLKGEYFSNTTLNGLPVLTRVDPEVNINLAGAESPGPGVPGDGWSARWTADLEITVGDTFTFSVNCQDGTRLWIDGQLIIDQWVTPTVTSKYFSLPVHLEPGIHSLVLEFFDSGGDAVEELAWSTATMAEVIVPAGPLQPPLRARATYPQDEAVDIPQDVTLIWSAGEKAAEHDVYFGDDEQAVADATTATAGIYQGRQAVDETTFTPGALEWNKTYYWRVDEVNDAEAGSPWKASVWSFTTADFLVIDDFESYSNEVPERIFVTWIDGLGYTDPPPGNPGNGSASFVGHDIWTPGTPYTEIVEISTVHSGAQSMPLYYNNDGDPWYSETERTWTSPQNWTVNGITDLIVWVRGNPARFLERGPASVTMSASGTDIWDAADQFRFAYKRLNGNGSMTARVDSVANTDGWAKAGVMIRETLDPDSPHAMAVITPSNGASFQRRAFRGDISANDDAGGIVAPAWVKITRTGNAFTAQYSEDGLVWNDFVDGDGNVIEINITMGSNVYIGLALTSHNANATTVAEFAEISTTGAVSGQFQVEDVGVAQPGNDPDQLYVALASGGNPVVVPSPVADAVLTNEWTELQIPLSDFAGVNLTAITKMIIGVGDRAAPVPAGKGIVFVDDVRVVRPEPATE